VSITTARSYPSCHTRIRPTPILMYTVAKKPCSLLFTCTRKLSYSHTFGLSTILLSRRTHEIGIHKILGASPSDIFLLLLKEFVNTVIIAAVIAIPIIYVTNLRWLDNFSCHTALTITTFIYTLLLALCIMLLSICYQTIKTMISDQIQSIHHV